MTASELFFYILFGVLLQVAVVSGLAFRRHMRSYRFLEKRLSGFDAEPPREPLLKDMMPGKAGPWEGFREFKVERKVFEDKDRNICSFYLKPVDGGPLPMFKPGQFLTFKLDVFDPATNGANEIVRCYSLSDRPGRDYYRVSIKRVPPPAKDPCLPPGLSSNHFHDNVHEGDVLTVRAPSGHFFLEGGTSPVVLIGGGIGITPMLSMLNNTISRGRNREIWLFYGVRNSAEHAMKEHLEALAKKHDNFRMHVCYSAPLAGDKKGADYHHKGRVDVPLLRLTLPFKLYEFYICGPRQMMETMVPALEEWGVPDQHINYEAFGPASITRSSRAAPKAAKDATPVKVTFSKSGKTVTWDGSDDTLLDFAERNGIDVESGCRAGGCGSCQTTIKDGEVTYTQAPDFDAEPGSCLLCVSRPKQDLTLEV